MACAPYCVGLVCSDEEALTARFDGHYEAKSFVLAGVLDCVQWVGEGGVHGVSPLVVGLAHQCVGSHPTQTEHQRC